MPTKKQLKAQNKAEKKAIKQQEKYANNQQGVVPYGQHKKASWRKSTSDQAVTYPRYTPQQEQIFNTINKYLQGGQIPSNNPIAGLNRPGNNPYAGFEPIEQQARQGFLENTVPLLAERLSSLGSGIANTDPRIAQTLGAAGRGLENDIAALRAQYGLQNQQNQAQNYFNLLNTGLTQQSDIGIIPGQDSWFRSGAKAVAGALPDIVSGGLTGGASGAGLGALKGLGAGQMGQAIQQRQNNPQFLSQDISNPQYQQASANQYQQQQNTFNPNVNPLGAGNAITQGYYNKNAVPGFGQQTNFNPYEVANSTVRGFGQRTY